MLTVVDNSSEHIKISVRVNALKNIGNDGSMYTVSSVIVSRLVNTHERDWLR